MHWTTHIIIGAALGYSTGRPFLSELAGIAEHITLDMMPHHDPKTDFGHAIDAMLGLTVLRTLAKSEFVSRIDPDQVSMLGAIGGALPDLELVIKAVTDIDPERFYFPSHNGLLPHGATENKIFSYTLEVIMMLGSIALARRKYLKTSTRYAGHPCPDRQW